jgi:hypothetical protein
MKNIVMGIVLGTSLLSSAPSYAGVTDAAGTWAGAGAAFNADGTKDGDFSVNIVSQAVGDHELDSTIAITVSGKTERFHQKLTDSGDNGFLIKSDQGNGGGFCLGKGLCEAYLGTREHGYAVTVILDRPDSRRYVVTELENKNVVRFVRESLERVQ